MGIIIGGFFSSFMMAIFIGAKVLKGTEDDVEEYQIDLVDSEDEEI